MCDAATTTAAATAANVNLLCPIYFVAYNFNMNTHAAESYSGIDAKRVEIKWMFSGDGFWASPWINGLSVLR